MTVPDGGLCENGRQRCRFLQYAYNDPSQFCFLIPESRWMNSEKCNKHPKCPSLYTHRKCKAPNEETDKINRLRIWQQIENKNTLFCPHCMKPICIDPNGNYTIEDK
jgi:hypothetical protein